MKLILLYGNGLSAMSKRLGEIKRAFDPLSIVEFDGKSGDFERALIEFSTPGLFFKERLVVLENFDIRAGTTGGVDFEKLPDDPNLTVVIKYPKNLVANSVILKAAVLKKAEILCFSEKDETGIFPFLDALAEKESERVLNDLDRLLDEYGSQYILTMLFFMYRRLIKVPGSLPNFVQKKIELQRKNFSLDKITRFYRETLETDFKIKSGLIDERSGLAFLVNNLLTI